MFNLDAHPRQGAIISTLLLIQRTVLRRFERQPRQRMTLLQSLIAQVRAAVSALIQAQRLLSRQGFVMARTVRKGTRQHHPAVRFDQQLSLEAVALFLATVVTTLFFLGRSAFAAWFPRLHAASAHTRLPTQNEAARQWFVPVHHEIPLLPNVAQEPVARQG